MTPPDAQIPAPVILERTATHRMVWVDVARVIACILILSLIHISEPTRPY